MKEEDLGRKKEDSSPSSISPLSSSSSAFQTAFCVVVEEGLSAIQSRVSEIDKPLSGGGALSAKKRSMNIYGGIFPLEEVTDMIFRTVSPSAAEPGGGGFVGDGLPGSVYSATTTTGHPAKHFGTAGGGSSGSSLDRAGPASRNELTDRFAALVDLAIDFIVHGLCGEMCDRGVQECEEHVENLGTSLMSLMITEVQLRWENPKRKGLLTNIQKLRRRLLILVNSSLSPGFRVARRLKVVRMINNQFRNSDVLNFLFEGQQNLASVFVVYLEDLVVNHKEEMPVDDIIGCKQFFDFLQTCGLAKKKLSPSEAREAGAEVGHADGRGETRASSIKFELDRLSFQAGKARSAFWSRCLDAAEKQFARFDDAERQMSRHAFQVTKLVMSAQDEERKRFMSELKRTLNERVRALQLWQVVASRHTHERAAWHFTEDGSRPWSWSLSETEGAQRVRIKLERRCSHLPARCYLPEHRPKAAPSSIEEEREEPFAFLAKGTGGMSAVIIEQLSADDSIRMMEGATLIMHDLEIRGEVLISDSALYFVEQQQEQQEEEEEDSRTNQRGRHHQTRPVSFSWKMNTVREIHRRWFQLSDVAVEIFFSTSSSTRLFVFADSSRRNLFIRRLVNCQPHLSHLPHPDYVMELWQDGAISNFDYLMQLNKLAGRTFNDLMQYPVFPFILADYNSAILDLYSTTSFRDLRRPIAVQNKEREERYVSNYRTLAEESERSDGNGSADGGDGDGDGDERSSTIGNLGPYHYGSHYSNAGIVLHFLVRVPPFTSMFLRFQDGSFDIPDRSFHSLSNTWRLSSRDSTTDVKELIPDLFCLPELLVNSEGLDLGERQDGRRVRDVELPPWAAGSPRLFIKVHRQALESDHVREHLCHWIDLVFGYKQKGKEAVAAVNVFHPSTYYGFDLNTIKDPVQRSARATMIKMYGQTPKQLFQRPHPMVTRYGLS